MEVENADTAAAPVRHSRELIGARLAAARAAAGLDLADIARETRVPLRHLRAIEADTHDELPALPYAIGFVKALARAVGVDAEAASAQFKAETSKLPHAPVGVALEPLDERRLPPRGVVVASVAATLLLLGGLGAYGAGWFDAPVPSAPQVAAVPAPSATSPAPALTQGVTPLPSATTGVAVQPTVQTTAPLSAPPPSATAPLAVAQPAPAGAPGSVSIVAADDSWIRITHLDAATGRIASLKTGLLAKGERYDLPPGETGARLWTGRAGALQISVAGRSVPPLGGPVETVKNVSLDPAALLARGAAPAAGPTVTPPR